MTTQLQKILQMKPGKRYKNYKRIVPLVKRCAECKKCKVVNHHFLCDICWGKKEKTREIKKKRKLLKHQQTKRTELERVQLRANKNLKCLDNN